MSAFKQAIDILTDARNKINEILTGNDNENHRIRIETNLNRDINNISLLTGVGTDLQDSAPTTLPPSKFAPLKARHVARELSPKENEVNVLRQKVESAFHEFQTLPSKEILTKYEDMVIRGVARKVQMKVTADEPEKLTLTFINQIKKEIAVWEEKRLESIRGKDTE